MALKPRQERLLRVVVEEYISSGSPVGSKHLSETRDFGVAASTIRSDLALLESSGLLAHPHTSAGRVPTDSGYRRYADAVIAERRPVVPLPAVAGSTARTEIGEALRETAEALSRVTELLAIISAPSLTATTIRHIEVLALQARTVMVVVITTSGLVTKRVFQFEQRVDPGLAEFARVYLNERLSGVRLGTRLIESAFASVDLGASEKAFLLTIKPAFEAVGSTDPESLHVGGAARLLSTLTRTGATELSEILDVLEQRYGFLEYIYEALRGDGIYLRIGHELQIPSLQACSLVVANYGVANRSLGTVSVLGPTRMDYPRVIATVRATADCLSAYLEEIW